MSDKLKDNKSVVVRANLELFKTRVILDHFIEDKVSNDYIFGIHLFIDDLERYLKKSDLYSVDNLEILENFISRRGYMDDYKERYPEVEIDKYNYRRIRISEHDKFLIREYNLEDQIQICEEFMNSEFDLILKLSTKRLAIKLSLEGNKVIDYVWDSVIKKELNNKLFSKLYPICGKDNRLDDFDRLNNHILEFITNYENLKKNEQWLSLLSKKKK